MRAQTSPALTPQRPSSSTSPSSTYMLRLQRLTRQLQQQQQKQFRQTFATMSSPATLPSKMRAIQIQKQGGLDVIEERQVDVPKPGPGQTLIKVEYAGVNFIDTYHRGGLYKLDNFPFTLGQEAAGTIVALHDDTQGKGLAIGDKVVYYFGGSFAEYAAVPRFRVAKLQPQFDTKIGAAALLQGLTAWTLLRETYAVKKDDWVLVHAAAGGVGLLLCQMAKHLGAHVIGTTSTEEKAELAKQNGAEHVINYSKENTVDKVLALTNGNGVQAIYDGVGKDTWEDDFKMIARKGTIATFGNASGAVEPFSVMKLAGKNVKVARPTLVNYVATQEEMDQFSGELFDLIDKGVVKIRVHGEYPLSAEGIRQAQDDITSRKTTGKLVVKAA